MARLIIFATLAFLLAAGNFIEAGGAKGKDKTFEVKGKFTKDDPKDQQRSGAAHTHMVALKKGTTYTIDMVSSDVDSYLRLLDPKGKQLDEDDDSGGNLNSRIVFNCNADGDYTLVATTFGPNMYGAYVLTVKAAGALATPSTSHSAMVGKAAPDFTADFAVNGKPGKRSDFKDKIVLMVFFEVRSSACAELLPKLNDLQKSYKDQGLVVAGITYYMSDIGQAIAFDKETGATKTVKKGDRAGDQAVLREYAAYHKLTIPLLALPKQDALSAFDAYAVNGVPQLVLIDRQGRVRRIDVTGMKAVDQVEAEIKKLTTEK